MDCNTCGGRRECMCEKDWPLSHKQAFIREAAMRFASAVDSGPANHDACGHTCLLAKPDEAWALARALWDAKPEDC